MSSGQQYLFPHMVAGNGFIHVAFHRPGLVGLSCPCFTPHTGLYQSHSAYSQDMELIFKSISQLLSILLISSSVAEQYKSTKEKSWYQDTSRSKRSTEIDDLKHSVKTLGRQLILQQLYNEEQTRSSGSSGLKRVRLNKQGSRTFYTPTYGDASFAAIHSHANYKHTMGLGELAVVLNGVEFRTRHLDYPLKQKSRTTTNFGKMDEIEFPEVPPDVLKKGSVAEQVAEMKEWFRAYKEQNAKIRDYTKYFKHVLCYMEGMWTHSDSDQIEEPFESTRHHLDAGSWFELQEKVRFTSYTGTKDVLENYAYLPTTVMNITEDGKIKLAQWNFKISCHPLDGNLHTSRMRLIDDIKARMSLNYTMEQYEFSRAARYEISPVDRSRVYDQNYRRNFYDTLMEQLPGLDNYPAKIIDDSFDDVAYPFDRTLTKPLNMGYYRRWYRSLNTGAMGLTMRHRGFSDENVFMAMTTQDQVAGIEVKSCTDPLRPGHCKSWHQKMSYAIPLEIIVLTPLTNWNPYSLKYKGKLKSPEGRSVVQGPKGPRTGGPDKDDAYDGTNDNVYYFTPDEFLDPEIGVDPADTSPQFYYVLDKKGQPKKVGASGHRILINVKGVGAIRQRYPIMPLHEEGSSAWKHVEALAEIVLHPEKYKHLMRSYKDEPHQPQSGRDTGSTINVNPAPSPPPPAPQTPALLGSLPADSTPTATTFQTQQSSTETGHHIHTIRVSAADMAKLFKGNKITAETNVVKGHKHSVIISTAKRGSPGKEILYFNIFRCDGKKSCSDNHNGRLNIVPK